MLERLLIVSAILFCIGLYGVLSRRHIIAVIMSVEIMFNAVNVALVAFSRYTVPAALRFPGAGADVERFVLEGQTLAVFVIVVAAAEVALGLALIIALARRRDTIHISDLNTLRH